MHFIIGANAVDSRTTGLGRQMHGLGGALAARGHRVDYLFADPTQNGAAAKLSRLTFPFHTASRIRAWSKGASDRPIAILHEPTAWATALILRRRVRTIAMVHNCELKVWRTRLSTRADTGEAISLKSRMLWPLTELTQSYASIKVADLVCCLSSEDRDYMVTRAGVPADRIQRIDNGLERDFLGLPFPERPPERDVLFLGHWLPHKGTRVLAAALDKLSATGRDCRLTLAGTTASADEVLAALPAAWRASVEVVPRVEPEHLVALYRRHRIFVLPSIFEGIPLSMLEAMACGLCPIVSDVGGVRDVIQSGRNGVLVPRLDTDAFAAALGRTLASPDEARTIARAAHESMQGYGWSRAAEQVERACRSRWGGSAGGGA
jgi:glycosyltransferase involved in cell wall biosynthesis